ncbi:MAG: glycerol-3-phosphate acyltransferase PlsX [Flavobacteriales bacterium]
MSEHPVEFVAVDTSCAEGVNHASVRAAARATLDFDLDIALVGDAAALREILRDTPYDAERLQVVHAPEVLDATLSARDALSVAPNSATRVGLDLVASRLGAAFVTSHHPGATVGIATRVLGRLPGVSRAAMAAVVPTARHRGDRNDPFALMLDIGATISCTGADLATFAHMGATYSRLISENNRPSVALLSNHNHVENSPKAVRDAHALLLARAGDYEYLGPMTADHVPAGEADVVVTDGYSGQLFVRTLEGVALTAERLLAQARDRFAWRVGVTMLGGGIERLRELTNWEHYGGAPLLGVDRTVIVTQHSDSSRPMLNAIRLAAKVERLGVRQAMSVDT